MLVKNANNRRCMASWEGLPLCQGTVSGVTVYSRVKREKARAVLVNEPEAQGGRVETLLGVIAERLTGDVT